MKFTKKQLENWKRYEEVRAGGKWNMFDKNAQITSGLNRQEYLFCMRNYSGLKKEVENDRRNKNK